MNPDIRGIVAGVVAVTGIILTATVALRVGFWSTFVVGLLSLILVGGLSSDRKDRP